MLDNRAPFELIGDKAEKAAAAAAGEAGTSRRMSLFPGAASSSEFLQ